MAKRPDIAGLAVWKNLAAATVDEEVRAYKEAKEIAWGKIRPNPDQPRKSFDPAELAELASSIREHGLLQPLLVRPEGDGFVIIAGERRWRALEKLGWEYVPCIIRDATQLEAIEKSLIENLKRVDLPPVEEARCYQQLRDAHNYSIRDLSKKLDVSVGYIHSRLGLLDHEDLSERVEQGEIGIFEARELAKIKDETQRRDITEQVATKKLDRAGLKREVKRLTAPPKPPKSETKTETTADAEPSDASAPEIAGAAPPDAAAPEIAAAETPVVVITTPAAPPAVTPSAETGASNSSDSAPVQPPPMVESPAPPPEAPLFNADSYTRRWSELRRDLEHDVGQLAVIDKVRARQLLQEMQATIAQILTRLE